MRPIRALTVAIAVACVTVPTAAAAGGQGDVPRRVDDFDRRAAEQTWVNHVDRGSPRVDDFDTTPVG